MTLSHPRQINYHFLIRASYTSIHSVALLLMKVLSVFKDIRLLEPTSLCSQIECSDC